MKVLLLFFVLFLSLPVQSLEATLELIVPETVVPISGRGSLTHTEWRFNEQTGHAFGVHRYRLSDQTAVARLLYLPGTNMNGTLKAGNLHHNLWRYLADRGVEVFTLDYRTRFIPHDTSGDLVFMRDWTMDLFVGDAERALDLIGRQKNELPLFVAGFSRGASYAYALAGRQTFAGLIALDGGFKSVPYKPFDLGGALRQFDADADYASQLSRRGYERRTQLMQDVIDNPDGPASDPAYENAADQLADVLYRAWGPGVLSNTQADVSDIQVLAAEMVGYDWFFPKIQDVESRSLMMQADDPRSSLDDHFGEMTLPILYIGSGRMSPQMLVAGIHSAGNAGSDDVSIHVLEEYGHLDVLFARDAPQRVYQVIADWIKARSVY